MNDLDGKICTNACEINAVHHCNLSCRSCSHMSPTFKKAFADPEECLRDLAILAKYVSPKMVRIVGGEPLLHPDLENLLLAVRSSKITNWLRLVTNGILLQKASPKIWSLVNEIYVSQYPGSILDEETKASLGAKAQEFGVHLQYNSMDYFRESYSQLGTEDQQLIGRIFRSCRVAHSWQCHTVYRGYYHLCPMSLFHSLHLNLPADAVKIIDAPALKGQIEALIARKQHLAGCKSCLGNAGKRFPHAQLRRAEWLTPTKRHTEELLDYEILSKLEADPNFHGD